MSRQWTKQKPTDVGWYFMRDVDKTKKGMEYHVVLLMAGWVHNVLAIEPFRLKDLDDGDVEFLGPIKPEHFLK